MSSSTQYPNRPQWQSQAPSTIQSTGSTRRLGNEDSWIEITSQPSSSSLSSVGDNDVVTTGLHVRRRTSRRRSQQIHFQGSSAPRIVLPARPESANGSSQDEYEESESESDRILSSSNEDVAANMADDDDNATALGVGPAENTVFTPQPNAFSHPPSTRMDRTASGQDTYFTMSADGTSAPVSGQSRSDNTITQLRSNLENMSSPRSYGTVKRTSRNRDQNNVQPDHDAALRASLTTLLSCAAAVRGSPKQKENASTSTAFRQDRAGPYTFRLVSESQMLEEESFRISPPVRHGSSTKSPPTKRKSRESSKERHSKKARNLASKTGATDQELALNFTLTAWMISAGVVLVFSAISFSAGYAWGKEVGRFEGEIGLNGRNCGQEVLRGGGGLRRLKWSTASSSIRA